MDILSPPLGQGVGYGVVVGLGLAFAAGMMCITAALKRSTGEDNSHFETFAVAGRKIGTGLTATAVISSWAWAGALLASTTLTYNFGVAGAYQFASGCLVQIAFFSLIAIQSKKRAPTAHTVLEIVKVRYGKTAHFVYMFLCLATNIIAYINMAIGASDIISSLTGVNTTACIFLLPVGVCLYTVAGGLKATFITDYMHTVALLIICVYLVLKGLTSDAIVSLDNLWSLVGAAQSLAPVSGNYRGSYLTMSSQDATAFGTLHMLGNFGLVLMDSSYWQKAFSADMTAAAPGYILGGVLYFAIPWCLGTVMGFIGVALSYSDSPFWPVQGRPLSTFENNAGMVLPYAAMSVCGTAGAVAIVIVVFMAVTSTTSAQLVAVSSIVSSDVYHTYINKSASAKSIINVSRLSCVAFALFGSALSTGLYYAGVNLTWTIYFLGILVCPGMVTIGLTVLWDRQTKAAAIVSPLVGMSAGLTVWLVTSSHYGGGVIDVATTGALYPCLYGNLASAIIPAVLSPAISFLFPCAPFSWEQFNAIELVKGDDEAASSDNKRTATPFTPEQLSYMNRMSKVSAIVGIVLFLGIWVIWPFGMYGAYYIFSAAFFKGWLVVSVIWLIISLVVVTFLPLLEGRHDIFATFKGVKRPKDYPHSLSEDGAESADDKIAL